MFLEIHSCKSGAKLVFSANFQGDRVEKLAAEFLEFPERVEVTLCDHC